MRPLLVVMNMLGPPGKPSPDYTRMEEEQQTPSILLEDCLKLEAAEPRWATPHILAAFAYIYLDRMLEAENEYKKAKELVPTGYEFESQYAPHFTNLEEVIQRHDPQFVP